MIKARIQRAEIDENNNIRVYTNYYNDNDELLNEAFGIYNFHSVENISDLMDKVDRDIRQHAETLIKRLYSRNRNIAEVGEVINRINNIGEIQVDRATLSIGRSQITVNENGIIPK